MTGVTPEKEIQNNNTQEPNNEGTPSVDFEARHKEASDTISKMAEREIKTNIKLAKANPEEILNMEGKLQNKVISEIYGYNNIEELKLIQGEEFWKSAEDKVLTEHDELAQQVKILQHQNKKSEINRALENYQQENKKIFEDNEDALEKIEGELAYISEKLPAKERVERAAKILYGNNYVDATTQAYLSMQDQSISAGPSGARANGQTKDTSFADFAKAGGFLK